MSKKIIASFTLFSFLIFTFSCAIHTTKKEKIETIASQKDQKVKIIAVFKKSGEEIKFPEKNPGRIEKNFIVGGATIEIRKSQIEKRIPKAGKIKELRTKDGQAFLNPIVVSETPLKIIIASRGRTTSIPIQDVELVLIKKVDAGASFLATIGAIAGIGLGGLLLIALLKESCPFIYSFDGENYVFDAEPYGGATCEGLKRTEWCGLQYIKEVDGQYRLRITNEVEETQYTDELRLVVIDHPRGVQVVPDESGQIHTFSRPISPNRAYDSTGRNLMPYFSDNDWIFWQTRSEDKDPAKKESLKEELIFEFPKPEGAEQAKLLFNGCNTLWASQMVKRYLELYGNKVQECYAKMNSQGLSYQTVMAWNEKEELYRLQIRVETDQGWRSKGTIVGGGPFVSEDKAYTLDVRDVPGNTLKIKLTPPAAFWMMNYIAVDYTDDLPVSTLELEPVHAEDHRGEDITEILTQNDKKYHIMPNIGDYADLTFKAPQLNSNMKRSVILKASGYYDIHLNATGEPRNDILSRFLTEPGFAIQYGFQEYLKWKKERLEKILR